MNIGTFTKTSDGFTGVIHTLTMTHKSVQIRPMDKTEGKGPDYRVTAGAADLGVAWKKTAKNDRDYLLVKLDAPNLQREIFANLFEGDDGHDLVWSRPRPKDKASSKSQAN